MDINSLIGTSTDVCQTINEYSTSSNYLEYQYRDRSDGSGAFTELATSSKPILTTSTVYCYRATDQYINYSIEIAVFFAVILIAISLFRR